MNTQDAPAAEALAQEPVEAEAFRARARQRVEQIRAAQKQLQGGVQPGEVKEPKAE